jgi:hypothetical protein
MNTVLDEAVELAGSEAKLIERMRPYLPAGAKVDRGHLYYWRRRSKNGVPGEFCRAIELGLDRRITAARLRPDLFGADDASTADGATVADQREA